MKWEVDAGLCPNIWSCWLVEKQCRDKIDVVDVGGCPLKLYSLG